MGVPLWAILAGAVLVAPIAYDVYKGQPVGTTIRNLLTSVGSGMQAFGTGTSAGISALFSPQITPKVWPTFGATIDLNPFDNTYGGVVNPSSQNERVVTV